MSAAFYAVFGVFVAAFVVLAVVTLRWAVRRDRAGRAEWVNRRAEVERQREGPADLAVRGNGHAPRGPSDRRRGRPSRGGARPPGRPTGRERDRGSSG